MVLDPQGYPLQQYMNLSDTVVWELLSNGTVILISGVTLSSSTGSPEGVVAAPVGSLYIQSDGVAPNIIWQKQTGTGNTGWVAMSGGSGTPPAAPFNAVQFDNAGAFGGSADLTWDNANTAFKDIGVANFVDTANTANIGAGLINGVAQAALFGDPTPDAAGAGAIFDICSTRTEIAPVDDLFVSQSIGLQVIPSGPYVGAFGPFYAGQLIGVLIPSTSTQKLSDAYGLQVAVVDAGSGIMNDLLAGVVAHVTHSGAAHSNGMIGVDGTINIEAGTIDQAYGLRGSSNAFGGTITRNIGVQIDAGWGFGGTLTHNYGLFISNQIGGGAANPDPWAIWTDGGKHEFKGDVISSGVISLGAATSAGVPIVLDTGFSRVSAGIMALGNGTAASVTGTLRLAHLRASALQVFANNAAAITGGLAAGDFYRTGADPDVVCVVH